MHVRNEHHFRRRKLSGRRLAVAQALAAAMLGAVAVTSLTTPAAQAAAGTPAAGPSTTEGMVDEQTRYALATAEAQRTGVPVEITSARTEATSLWANPTGTFTLQAASQPVRSMEEGQWRDIDTTLITRADGTITPTAVPGDLVLSPGGDGPFATLGRDGKAIRMTWPQRLPKPVLDGATATYPDVRPGIDLQVTAEPAGGFRQLLIVRDRTAAKDPSLDRLRIATSGSGLTLRKQADGTLTAVDTAGTAVFAADRPVMWASPARDRMTGMLATDVAGSVLSPVVATSPMATEVSPDAVVITPQQAVLDDPATAFPVYIDPTPVTITRSDWTHVSKDFPNQSYWSTDRADGAKVGYSGDVTYRSYFLFGIGSLAGKDIVTAKVNTILDHSYQCGTSTDVDLYQTADISRSASVTWNNSVVTTNKWLAKLDTSAGHANTSCGEPDAPIEFASTALTTLVKNAAGAAKQQLTFGLRAPSETTTSQWKKFYADGAKAPTLYVEYNTAPAMPSDLNTWPVSTCRPGSGNPDRWPATDDNPVFTAALSDADANNLTAELLIEKVDGTDVHTSTSAAVPSGAPVTWPAVPDGKLLPNIVYSYTARAKDTTGAYSLNTPKCYFVVDATPPQTPAITVPDPEDVIPGQVASVSVTPGAADTDVAGYRYGYDAADVLDNWVPAAANGSATIPVTLWDGCTDSFCPPVERSLFLVAVDRAGNSSEVPDTEPAVVVAGGSNTATPVGKVNDVNGDGRADVTAMLDMGGGNAAAWTFTNTTTGYRPTIAWQATGYPADRYKTATGDLDADGRNDLIMFRQEPGKVQLYPIRSDTVELSLNSAGVTTVTGWANLADARIVAGDFTGDGKTDAGALVDLHNGGFTFYLYPSTGTGFGSVITKSIPASTHPGSIRALAGDINGDGKADLVIAQGYSTTATKFWSYTSTGTALNNGVLLRDDTAWSNPAARYVLTNVTGSAAADLVALYDHGTHTTIRVLASTAPTLAAPVQWWTNTATADQFEWRQATAFAYGNFDTDADTDFAVVAAGEAPGEQNLWTLDNAGTSLGAATKKATITASTARRHTAHWTTGEQGGTLLNDTEDAYPATSTALWSSPAHVIGRSNLYFTGSANAHYASPGRAVVDTTRSFTVSAWIRQTSTTDYRTVLSQDGVHRSGFYLQCNMALGRWSFSTTSEDKAAETGMAYYIAKAPAAPVLGTWTHLAGVYDADALQLKLYVNGVLAGTAQRPAMWDAPGPFQIGRAHNTTGTSSNWWWGGIDDVRVHDVALTGQEIAAIAHESQLVSNWKFDTSPFTADSGGYNRTLTLTGPVSGVGRFGTGLTFDGVNDYAGATGSVNADVSFTACAWAKPDSAVDYGTIIAQDGTYRSAFMLGHDGTAGRWRFLTTDRDVSTSGFVFQVNSTSTPVYGGWSHVCGVHDAGTGQNHIYVNGNREATLSNVPRTINLNGNTILGRGKWGGSYSRNYWKGGLDDVRVFTGVLDGDQIRAIMNG